MCRVWPAWLTALLLTFERPKYFDNWFFLLGNVRGAHGRMKRTREGEPSWTELVTEPELREAALERARADSDGATYVAASEAKGERELLLARAFAHPRDKHIRFVESSHSYYLDGKKLPISVSGLWARYFSHFNADAALRNIEKWREDADSPYYFLLKYLEHKGVPRQEHGEVVKQVWAANGEQASGAGTHTHRQIELCLNEEPHDDVKPAGRRDPVWRTRRASPFYNLLMYMELVAGMSREDAAEAVKEFAPPGHRDYLAVLLAEQQYEQDNRDFGQWKAWREDHPELIPVRTEMNVWSSELALAGQIDALMYDTERRHFVVVDWKRVQLLQDQAFRDERGKHPFEELPNTNLGHYYVQLNIYAGILRKWYGVDPERMVLVQVHPKNPAYKEYEVPMLKDQVDRVFEERMKEVNNK